MDDNSLPPSGRWRGYYLYAQGGVRHGQSMHLSFLQAQVRGDGSDGIGEFQIIGMYDPASRVARWTKRYTTHHVQYRGYFENGRIWGVWTIRESCGGFEIWPSLLDDKESAELERSILEVFEHNAEIRDLTLQQMLNQVLRNNCAVGE